MTKATKERMIAYLEKQLLELDFLIELNTHNDSATKSLMDEYRELIVTLSELRDLPTED